jgi:SNF2 family DNA or RNA helicase
MLVFSQFTSMLALLEEDLKKEAIDYYKITGETPKEKRLGLVHAFNEGTVPVFLISLKAGGAGLNLTGADVVIHYDPWWNLAAQNQATDRAHRIGQTRQVTVYKLLLKDTIEEKIMELQNAKRDLAEAILEGEASSIMSMSNEELLALLS